MAPDFATNLANALVLDEGKLEGDNAFALVDNVLPARSAGGHVTLIYPRGFGSVSGESSSLGCCPNFIRPGGDFPRGGGRLQSGVQCKSP
jgi:hypothetical protein